MAEGKEPKVDLPEGGDEESVGSESSKGDIDHDSNIYPREAHNPPQTGNPQNGNLQGGNPSSPRSLVVSL